MGDMACARDSGGRHAECIGKKAQGAAILQEELCVPILRGFKAQMLADGRMRYGEIGVVAKHDGVMMDGADEIRHVYPVGLGLSSDVLVAGWRNDLFFDDLTGLPLPPEL